MPSTPPALPAKEAKPARSITEPLKVGEDFDIYKIAECSPDRLRFTVNSGCLLIKAVVAGVVAIILLVIGWNLLRTVTVTDTFEGKFITWGFVAALLSVGSLFNMGRSMVIDRVAREVRMTRFFFSTTRHETDRLKAVRIEIIEPMAAGPVTPPNQGNAQPPVAPKLANRAVLSLVGQDDAFQPMEIKLGDSNLHAASNWPVLVATALHLSRMFKVPLTVDGAIDRASESVQQQIQDLPKVG